MQHLLPNNNSYKPINNLFNNKEYLGKIYKVKTSLLHLLPKFSQIKIQFSKSLYLLLVKVFNNNNNLLVEECLDNNNNNNRIKDFSNNNNSQTIMGILMKMNTLLQIMLLITIKSILIRVVDYLEILLLRIHFNKLIQLIYKVLELCLNQENEF